jgi:hypothetical protein
MSRDERNGNDDGIEEAGEANAGEPQERHPGRGVAGEAPPKSAEALDERQERMRTTRRQGGPDLGEGAGGGRGMVPEDVPDVEPTETEEDTGDEG